MNNAENLRLSKRYDEALGQYRDLLRVIPNNPIVLKYMGITYFSAGRIDDAINAFRESLKYAPNDFEAQQNLEVALKAKEQKSKGSTARPILTQ
jgi:tetratricopeptide (TPR) repeat protein